MTTVVSTGLNTAIFDNRQVSLLEVRLGLKRVSLTTALFKLGLPTELYFILFYLVIFLKFN
jgi:hypothetical protein